ncbi:MAG: BatD family protein, partial [Bacteroidia bacterium]
MNFILKKEIKLLVCLFSFFVVSLQPVIAQTPFLAATANKSTIGLNEQLQITYTFNGAGRSFQGPDLREFNILSGPNQSSNMQYINGQFSQSISFTYYLQARNVGNFKIGPASIDAEGKRIASNVVQVTVVKGAAQQQKKNNDEESILTDKNIFAKAILSKSTLMKGEGALLTFKLYSNVTLIDFAIPKMPNYDGFWNQDIQLPQALERNTEVIDGQRYTVWEIKKLVLFP